MNLIDKRGAQELKAATVACAVSPKVVSDWPDPISPEGLYGLAGDIVGAIAPHTEADDAALLIQFLAAFGNAVGRGPYFRAGADRHHLNLFGVLVGQSSRGRKGSSWSQINDLLLHVDEDWASERVTSGLASGEGLIWAVRDQIEKQEPIRAKDKTITGYQTLVEDPGITDKRLMILEPEFARVLQVSQRDSNTLSATIRQAWDSGKLRTMTRSTPAKATGAHISIIGHITRDELLKCLTSTEAGNGFANRFLWVGVRRSKLLPDGGAFHTVNLQPLLTRLLQAIQFARTTGELTRDEDASELWREVYPQLTAERHGMYGATTSRAEAQTLRLSCLFAVLDRSAKVCERHLTAALEVWRYCEDSARFIFGSTMGDATSDALLAALRSSPGGLTRQDIIENVFRRNKRAEDINRAMDGLIKKGLAYRKQEKGTGGRPVERWFRLFQLPGGGFDGRNEMFPAKTGLSS